MKKWYAIYTRSRYEKKVSTLLIEKGVVAYLPLLKTKKQWSDRKKTVHEPLFKSYLFVYILPDEFINVLSTQGVVCFVKITDKPVVVPQNQINAIKYYLNEEKRREEDENAQRFSVGQVVEVVQGPLIGLRGSITTVQGNNKLRVKIEAINHFITITISDMQTERVKSDPQEKLNSYVTQNIA